jgi:hypothetical protein
MVGVVWMLVVVILLFGQGAAATAVMSMSPFPRLGDTPYASLRFRGGSTRSSIVPTGIPLWTNFVQIIKNARRHLVAAGVARTVSIAAMYPVDTIKARLLMLGL